MSPCVFGFEAKYHKEPWLLCQNEQAYKLIGSTLERNVWRSFQDALVQNASWVRFNMGASGENLERAVKALSEATDWLTLSSIGRSRIVSLTIIVPFVGYIIIFNDYIIGYFSFARAVILDISPSNGIGVDKLQKDISLDNLYFLYFGLLFVGIASALFSFFCPEEIKQYKVANDYIKSEDELKSPTMVISCLNYIFEKYYEANRENEGPAHDGRDALGKLEYTDEIQTLHYNLVYEIIGSIPNDELPGANSGEDEIVEEPEQIDAESKEAQERMNERMSEQNEFHYGRIYLGSGYLNIYGITEMVIMNRRIDFYFVGQFRQAANIYYKDILFIKFLCLRKSKSFLRMIIGALYVVGIVLLLLPTLKTSVFIVGLPFN